MSTSACERHENVSAISRAGPEQLLPHSFVGIDPRRKFLRAPFNETHENRFSTAKMNDVQKWR